MAQWISIEEKSNKHGLKTYHAYNIHLKKKHSQIQCSLKWFWSTGLVRRPSKKFQVFIIVGRNSNNIFWFSIWKPLLIFFYETSANWGTCASCTLPPSLCWFFTEKYLLYAKFKYNLPKRMTTIYSYITIFISKLKHLTKLRASKEIYIQNM